MLLFPIFVFATQLKVGDAQSQLSEAVAKTGVEATTIEDVASNILEAVFAMVGLLFFILIFYAGFSWLIAQGKEEQIKKAQSTLIGSIIGLLIVLGSYGITNFVSDRFIKGSTESNTIDRTVSEAEGGEPKACCLDRWETEGGYFGVGQSGWTGQVLTEKQCMELNLIKDYSLQNISLPRDGYWIEGTQDANLCQEAAQRVSDNQEWSQSSKWDNIGGFTDDGEEEPDDTNLKTTPTVVPIDGLARSSFNSLGAPVCCDEGALGYWNSIDGEILDIHESEAWVIYRCEDGDCQ